MIGMAACSEIINGKGDEEGATMEGKKAQNSGYFKRKLLVLALQINQGKVSVCAFSIPGMLRSHVGERGGMPHLQVHYSEVC